MTEKWGWYNSLYFLADKSILNIPKVTKMKAEECFTFMCYKQDISELERKEQLKQLAHARQH